MNRSHTRWPLVFGIVMMAATSSRTATSQKLDVAVKDRANAYASLAATGQFAAMTWGASSKDGATDIYVTTSRDGGRAFGAPTRVAGDAKLAGEQPPRIALIPRAGQTPSIVVVWTANGSAGTRILSARSNDAGRTFTSPTPVPGSDAAGNRGWESIATNGAGGVVALWLDHRDTASGRRSGAPMNHAEHQHLESGQHPSDGVARAQLSKLWFARIGGTGSPKALAGGVCYCCKTAIATDSAGAIYAAWRHVYDGNVRDIAFTKSSDNGSSFAPPMRVSDDNWVLDGCPENGPTMVVDDTKRIHIVWPTLVPGATRTSEPTLALFHSMSTDGKAFTARQRIPTDGVPRHPQMIVAPNGGLLVTWDEQAKGTRRVALARGSVDGTGVARFTKLPIGDGTRAEYPVLAAVGDATLVAWTSGSAGQTVLRVERLVN
jgi:hypothetical protein